MKRTARDGSEIRVVERGPDAPSVPMLQTKGGLVVDASCWEPLSPGNRPTSKPIDRPCRPYLSGYTRPEASRLREVGREGSRRLFTGLCFMTVRDIGVLR